MNPRFRRIQSLIIGSHAAALKSRSLPLGLELVKCGCLRHAYTESKWAAARASIAVKVEKVNCPVIHLIDMGSALHCKKYRGEAMDFDIFHGPT